MPIISFLKKQIVVINAAMGHIICVASQKGGTGKTTTAVNLAASLALLEKDTLLVDCDPLGNATTGIGVDKGKLTHDLFDALVGVASSRDVLVDTSLDRLQVLPSRVGLHHAERILGGNPRAGLILRTVIREIAQDYTYTIVDSPPSFGFLTRSALTASDFLLLPLQHQIFSFEGLSQLLLMIRGIQKTTHPGLKIAGVFYTMCRNEPCDAPVSDSAELFFLKPFVWVPLGANKLETLLFPRFYDLSCRFKIFRRFYHLQIPINQSFFIKIFVVVRGSFRKRHN